MSLDIRYSPEFIEGSLDRIKQEKFHALLSTLNSLLSRCFAPLFPNCLVVKKGAKKALKVAKSAPKHAKSAPKARKTCKKHTLLHPFSTVQQYPECVFTPKKLTFNPNPPKKIPKSPFLFPTFIFHNLHKL